MCVESTERQQDVGLLELHRAFGMSDLGTRPLDDPIEKVIVFPSLRFRHHHMKFKLDLRIFTIDVVSEPVSWFYYDDSNSQSNSAIVSDQCTLLPPSKRLPNRGIL